MVQQRIDYPINLFWKMSGDPILSKSSEFQPLDSTVCVFRFLWSLPDESAQINIVLNLNLTFTNIFTIFRCFLECYGSNQ